MPVHKKQTLFLHSLFLFFLFVFCDFALKKFILTSHIDYLCNTGIAMSIALPQIIFIFLWIAVICLLLFLWHRERPQNIMHALPYILIFAGALGNLLDRMLYGCVIDYIPLLNISLFNLADFFITLGALLLIVTSRRAS